MEQRAPPRVHQHDARLHLSDGGGVDEVVRLVGQRTIQGDDVAVGPELFELYVLDPKVDQRLVRCWVGGENPAAEMPEEAGYQCANAARPDDAGRFAGQVET